VIGSPEYQKAAASGDLARLTASGDE
jgi:hypothetical protein